MSDPRHRARQKSRGQTGPHDRFIVHGKVHQMGQIRAAPTAIHIGLGKGNIAARGQFADCLPVMDMDGRTQIGFMFAGKMQGVVIGQNNGQTTVM